MKKTSLSVIFTLLIGITLQAQEKVRFRINPKQGHTLQYEMLIKTDIEGVQGIMIDMNIEMNLTPIIITDSTINIEVKHTKVRLDGTADNQLFFYDSSIDAQDTEMTEALAPLIDPMLKNTLRLEISPNGKVKNIDLPNVSEQAFDKGNMQNITPNFPDKEIEIGYTWKSEKSKAQFGLDCEITNTLLEKTTKGYKITTAGVFFNPSGKEIGEMNGYYIIDEKTHFTRSSLTNTSIDIEGQKIAMSIEMKQIN